MLGSVGFFVALDNHDDGIPDSLTSQEQDFVLATSEEWNCQMERVIFHMKEFVARPQNETVCVKALIDALKPATELTDRICHDPLFFVESHDSEQTEVSIQLFNEFKLAEQKMIDEVLRRHEDPDFEVDQESYDLLIKAFKQMSDKPTDFCDSRKCFWCKAKRHFKR